MPTQYPEYEQYIIELRRKERLEYKARPVYGVALSLIENMHLQQALLHYTRRVHGWWQSIRIKLSIYVEPSQKQTAVIRVYIQPWHFWFSEEEWPVFELHVHESGTLQIPWFAFQEDMYQNVGVHFTKLEDLLGKIHQNATKRERLKWNVNKYHDRFSIVFPDHGDDVIV